MPPAQTVAAARRSGIEPRRAVVERFELGEQLLLALLRGEADLPAEVRGAGVGLEQLVHQLLAQRAAVRGADVDELVVLPELVDARRVRRRGDERREDQPLGAVHGHRASFAHRPYGNLSAYCKAPVGLNVLRNAASSRTSSGARSRSS